VMVFSKEQMLFGLVLGLHAWSFITYGATYWYDAAIYAQLGVSLFEDGGISHFYSDDRYFWYQHIGLGAPLLWALADTVGDSYGWVVVTAIQKVLAASALLFFLYAIKGFVTYTARVGIAIFLSAYPFYIVFQNAFLTEAVSASLFLIGYSAALILERGDTNKPLRYLFIMTVSGMLLVQYRAYLVGPIVLYQLWHLVRTTSHVVRIVASMSVLMIVLSALVFPVVRWHETGNMFLPNVDVLSVGHALYVNVNPGENGKKELEGLLYPEGLSAAMAAERGLTHAESSRIASHMHDKGISEKEIKSRMRRIAHQLRVESGDAIMSQLKLNMVSLGLISIPFYFGEDEIVRRGYTNKKYGRHLRNYYMWQSWMQDSYEGKLKIFVQKYEDRKEVYDSRSIQLFVDTHDGYVNTNSRWLKDPLFLSALIPDYLFMAWIVSALCLWNRERTFVVMSALPVAFVYVISLYATVVGNVRYSHALLPLYVVGIAAFACGLLNRSRYRRM